MLSSLAPEQIVEHLALSAASLLGAERATIFVHDARTGGLTSLYALGENKPIHVPKGCGLAYAAFADKTTIVSNDTLRERRFYGGVDAKTGYVTKRILAVPLLTHAGRQLGVLEVLNKNGADFTSGDRDLAEALAAMASVHLALTRPGLGVQVDRLDKSSKLAQYIVGEHPSVQHLRGVIEKYAQEDLAVLVEGESGVGKELVARGLHMMSPRHGRPFQAVNCAAISPGVFEAEVFGHVRGAYTGAVQDRAGMFEAADHGTLFLDEIGDLPYEQQGKLLRVLSDKLVTPVGSQEPVSVDVRCVFATNRDLERMVAEGTFRDDLYYRIKALRITVPPLRERRSDISLLARHFLQQRNVAVEPAALALLMESSWPGNIRELMSVLVRAAVDSDHGVITAASLQASWQTTSRRAQPEPARPGTTLQENLLDAVRRTYEECGRNKAKTARTLGISRVTLDKYLRRLETRAAAEQPAQGA